MKLVLDTIAYAERRWLKANPTLASAPVFVHLRSDMASLNKVIAWGSLGDKSTWPQAVKGLSVWSLMAAAVVNRVNLNLNVLFRRKKVDLRELEDGEEGEREGEGGGVNGGMRNRSAAAPPSSSSASSPSSPLSPSSYASRSRVSVSVSPSSVRRRPLAPGGQRSGPGSKMVAVAAQRVDGVADDDPK